ncbi:MAG: sucrase ferredoxin [Microthrixaceae bacterium]
MKQAEGLRLEKVRCAEAHAAQDVDPAGTAPHWDAVLAIEVSSPWPRDISACEPFASLLGDGAATIAGPDGRTWRPQGLVCERSREWTRVIAFERNGTSAGPFDRREWLLPSEDGEALADLARALVDGDSRALHGHDQWRDDPEEGTVDLLLCTHGTRDVCCGGPGTALHDAVRDALGGADTVGPNGRRRIWRTSHAGGHRFAPTALSFPHGVSWAHLDRQSCVDIMDRRGDSTSLGTHMRGSVSVDAAAAQVADREGFSAFGWDWLDGDRTPVLVSHDRLTLQSTVDVLANSVADGVDMAVSVDVAMQRHIAMPTCGAVEGPEYKSEPVWGVLETRVG